MAQELNERILELLGQHPVQGAKALRAKLNGALSGSSVTDNEVSAALTELHSEDAIHTAHGGWIRVGPDTQAQAAQPQAAPVGTQTTVWERSGYRTAGICGAVLAAALGAYAVAVGSVALALAAAAALAGLAGLVGDKVTTTRVVAVADGYLTRASSWGQAGRFAGATMLVILVTVAVRDRVVSMWRAFQPPAAVITTEAPPVVPPVRGAAPAALAAVPVDAVEEVSLFVGAVRHTWIPVAGEAAGMTAVLWVPARIAYAVRTDGSRLEPLVTWDTSRATGDPTAKSQPQPPDYSGGVLGTLLWVTPWVGRTADDALLSALRNMSQVALAHARFYPEAAGLSEERQEALLADRDAMLRIVRRRCRERGITPTFPDVPAPAVASPEAATAQPGETVVKP